MSSSAEESDICHDNATVTEENRRQEEIETPETGVKRKAEVVNDPSVSKVKRKRKTKKVIDISELGDSEVHYKFSVKKQDLAKISPVFRRQFCGKKRKDPTESPEFLDLGDFSPEACTIFLIAFTEGTLGKDGSWHDVLIETCLLQDKYQIEKNMNQLRKVEDGFDITKDTLFSVVKSSLKFKSMPPVEELCKRLLRRCAKTANEEGWDLFDIWMKYGNEDGEALAVLKREVDEVENEELDEIGCYSSDD